MSVETDKPFSIKTRQVIDEDALLTEEDRQEKKATASKEEDCTTRRRACKNCTCGRAQLEQQQGEGVQVDVDFQPPAGGCGNCAKGDAFRCAGCPYLGKPAWNTEEDGKVQLNLTDDA